MNFPLQKICAWFIIVVLFLPISFGAFGGFNLKIDELVFATFGAIFFLFFCRLKSILSNPIIITLALYSGFQFIPSVTGFISGTLNWSWLIYELRWGLTLFFVLGLITFSRNIWGTQDIFLYSITKPLLVVSVLQFGYVSWQLLSGNLNGFYLASAIGLDGASSGSGALFFLMIFLGALVRLVEPRKGIFIVVLGVVCLLATLSRTWIISTVISVGTFLCVILIFHLCKSLLSLKIPKSIGFILGLLSLSILFAVAVSFELFEASESRIFILSDAINSRKETISGELHFFCVEPLACIFGSGRGFFETNHDVLKIGMHSQISRTLIEGGFLGLMLLFSIYSFCALRILKGRQSFHAKGILVSFLIGFIFSHVSYDVLVISKSLHWFVIFLMLIHLGRSSETSVNSEAICVVSNQKRFSATKKN